MSRREFIKVASVALAAIGIPYCGYSTLWDAIANAPLVHDKYQQGITYKGVIESRYARTGSFEVGRFVVESGDIQTKKFMVWYPKELEQSSESYPAVIMANGTGVFASRYKPVFEHLASWGFIVVGNEDGSSWNGKSSASSLDFLLAQNQKKGSVFYGKVNTNAVGIAGHSQGGVGVFNAAIKHPNGIYYKALCAQSCTQPQLAEKLSWPYSVDSVRAPVLAMAGTGKSDSELVCPLPALEHFFSRIEQPVVIGRIKNTEHGDVLIKGDAYMTAWMRFWLCGDEEAGRCFKGEDAEMLKNQGWQDQKRKGL